MKTVAPARLLKFALTLDAAASLSLAAIQLLLSSLLAQQLSLPSTLLTETGLFLAVYALALGYLARAPRVPAALIQFIIIGNLGWALACVFLACATILAPGALGIAFLLAQALAVLLFAYLEFAGLRASHAQASERAGQLRTQ